MLATSQIPTSAMGLGPAPKDTPSTTACGCSHASSSSSETPPYESKWKTTNPVSLTRESFLDLIYGRTPLIKEAQFISKDQSQAVYEHLGPRFSPYLHATGPPVSKVGVAQFEFQAQSQEDFKNRSGNEKQRYFNEVAKVRSLHDELATTVPGLNGENIWKKVIAAIQPLVPEWDVCLANEAFSSPSPSSTTNLQETEYFSGIIRKINAGVPIHCDWAPYDTLTESWILSKITHQAVFNLYLSPFTRGGSTTVFDVQWSPDALQYRDPSSYGYFEELVKGQKQTTFQPEMGDLYFFNSRNMHTVAPLEEVNTLNGEGKVQDAQQQNFVPRMAMASFIGLLPAEVTGGKPKLMFWS
ncbi:hypothetical protein QBC37DRAFT_409552 [Rhypophila decipiens]|uniref:Uncharacterized protein n=1 Tax=Rhypophila decipiens TaxID=261697 RepID=A0AAN6YI23_9PEZI|nr:hypothetical protein QBC37DRAFT_409552 [Rhypophila decipiens]